MVRLLVDGSLPKQIPKKAYSMVKRRNNWVLRPWNYVQTTHEAFSLLWGEVC